MTRKSIRKKSRKRDLTAQAYSTLLTGDGIREEVSRPSESSDVKVVRWMTAAEWHAELRNM